MGTLSTYTFLQGVDNGTFIGSNVPDGAPPSAPTFQGIIERDHRADSEQHFVVGPFLNTPPVLSTIDKLLTQSPWPAVRTSPVRAQRNFWVEVPYFFQHPLAHPFNSTFVRAHFTFHLHTPWYLTDAEVTVSYYLLPRIVNKHLNVKVDGAWVLVDGGWPDGQAIADQLGTLVLAERPAVQKLIDAAIGPLADITLSSKALIYVLPGSGKKTTPAAFAEDASLNAAVAIVP